MAYLQTYYLDRLARLRPLGDLFALGGTPEHCEEMDADRVYIPSRHADYSTQTYDHRHR